jgi:hypothetical protein
MAECILSPWGSKIISSGSNILGGWKEWCGLGRGDQFTDVISSLIDYGSVQREQQDPFVNFLVGQPASTFKKLLSLSQTFSSAPWTRFAGIQVLEHLVLVV